MSSTDILNGILKRLLIKKEDISEHLFIRIQNALKQFMYVSNDVKASEKNRNDDSERRAPALSSPSPEAA